MSLGERFVAAIADRDVPALRELLAADVDFKGLTPGRLWEARTPDEVVEVLLDNWFEEQDHVDEVAALEEGPAVVDVRRVGYRFAVTTPDGPHLVEQQAYYRDDGDQIGYLRVVCSGFRPTSS